MCAFLHSPIRSAPPTLGRSDARFPLFPFLSYPPMTSPGYHPLSGIVRSASRCPAYHSFLPASYVPLIHRLSLWRIRVPVIADIRGHPLWLAHLSISALALVSDFLARPVEPPIFFAPQVPPTSLRSRALWSCSSDSPTLIVSEFHV